MMEEKGQNRHDRYDVFVCANEWYCPIHEDLVTCYLEKCEEYTGEITADWMLKESS